MVNDRFPGRAAPVSDLRRQRGRFSRPIQLLRIDSNVPDPDGSKCLKILTRIRVEYGQKSRASANRAFKALC
jgi:hypothetical protein